LIVGLLTIAVSPGTAMGEEAVNPPPGQSVVQFPAQIIDPEPPRYTGEPITLSLKDADLRDVFKTFAVLTEINIVVDPSVRGKLTLELHDVPWDQAFELILHLNGLDYHLTDNVMYIAPLAKLARVPLGQ
jgi:type IV pilus assembly protein PilQ